MVSFSQLPAVKKYTIFGVARKIFGPSYFVTALMQNLIKENVSKSGGCKIHPLHLPVHPALCAALNGV